uniref:Uncharacterized protein n=1 Tax=Tanacetum cinerariifolium TaxID=118510 RepID=A0A699HF58_TANCI|nr:hypothetical protein [Tanacetum cinerariifolium]
MSYNKGMPRRKWSSTDQIQSQIIVEMINELLWERRVMRNLERLVGARELKMAYRLMQRTTHKEETALCKGCVRIFEDNVVGNVRRERGFLVEVVKHMLGICPIAKLRTYDMVNEKWKTVSRKVASFCGGVKKCDKWNSEEVLEFLQVRKEKKNKRYKSSGSSSFNTRESAEGSINLNTTVWDEKDEVEEVRRSRPIGIDQAKRKAKAGSSAATRTTFKRAKKSWKSDVWKSEIWKTVNETKRCMRRLPMKS